MQCTAKRKHTGEQCKAQAVKGRATCRMHGGTNPGRPIIHGRYSKSLDKHPDVKANYEEAKADPALMETLNEIALLRAKLQHYLDAFASMRDPTSMQAVLQYVDSISKLVERRHKLIYGEQITITQGHFTGLVSKWLELVKEIYGDDDRYATFLKRSRSLASADPDRAGTGEAESE